LENLHNLLQRQFQRHIGNACPLPEEWRGFIRAVNDAYREFDADRGMLERSLELSSQELLQANSEMRAIYQAIPDLLFLLDSEGRILECQASATTDYFFKPVELLGKRIQDLPFGTVVEEFQQAIQRVKATKAMVSMEYSLLLHNKPHSYEARLLPLIGDQLIVIVRNITERKETEQRLKESEQHLESIIQGSPIATFVIAKDHRVTHWNKALEELSQIKGWEMIGTSTHWQAFYPSSRPCMADLLVDEDLAAIPGWYHDKCSKSKLIPDAVEATDFFPKLGRQGKWLHFTAAAIRNSRGEVVGAIETLEDITDRKLAEEAFKESQQQVANIVDFLPDATFAIDTDGRIITWNRAMEEITGCKASAMLGKDNHEYAVPFYGERRPLLIDLVFKPQKEAEALYANVEKKGSILAGESYTPALQGGGRYLYGMASALRDSKGNIIGAIESIRDITERKRMEEALAAAEEKYRSIFENAVDGIFQTIPAGRIINANPAFARILQYDSPEEMTATLTDIAHQLYVDPGRRAELFRLVEKEGVVRDFEVRFYRKDKNIVWIKLNARAVRDESGQISYLEGTAQDITERKALESRLFQAQKMDAIGTLAGGIAHDFNNLLVPIIGYTELALNKIPQEDRMWTNLQHVLTSAHRAKDLVKQILTFSRRTEQERKPIQMGSLVKETLKLIRASLPSTIEIRQQIEPDATASMVMADPTQMHQVLMNLCANAGHAMSMGGGVLEVSLSNEEVGPFFDDQSRGLEPGPYIRIVVRDTGHGMDAGLVKRIFDPYFTTKKPGEGTGLGLAVVYSIVKNHEGAIHVYSEPGKGSAFHVYLPRVESASTVRAEMTTRLPMGSGRILAVDDDEMIIELERQIFQELGYEVTTTASSVEALALFQRQPDRFDLVFTDHTMPHLTGLDLAREIFKIRPDLPIVLCSGFSDFVAVEKARAFGVRAVIPKPLVIKEVAETLQNLLGARPR